MILQTRFLGFLAGAILMAAALTACQSENGQREMNVGDDLTPPRRTVAGIMIDKLAHAQAIMEGLSLADFRQVEVNAVALYELSQKSDWMVHRTVSFTAFSDEFRGVMLEMANHARDEDFDAVTNDYLAMTNSCIACHEYLRRENLISDFPGRVGWNRGSILQGFLAVQ